MVSQVSEMKGKCVGIALSSRSAAVPGLLFINILTSYSLDVQRSTPSSSAKSQRSTPY
jgi:hypothetical protein